MFLTPVRIKLTNNMWSNETAINLFIFYIFENSVFSEVSYPPTFETLYMLLL